MLTFGPERKYKQKTTQNRTIYTPFNMIFGTFPKDFSQGATSQMGNFISGYFPKVRFRPLRRRRLQWGPSAAGWMGQGAERRGQNRLLQSSSLMFIYLYKYLYMLAIAGQTAGPNWLNFYEETHGYPWDRLKILYFSSKFDFKLKIQDENLPGGSNLPSRSARIHCKETFSNFIIIQS